MGRHEKYMRMAMEEAEKATQEGGASFGVVVVDANGEVVWRDHDRVKATGDPTAHGEINAVRGLCKRLGTLSLEGYTIYSVAEPCPMCLATCIKSRVSNIYYGAEIEKTASLPIPVSEMVRYAKKYPIRVEGGVLAKECLEQRLRLGGDM